MSKLQVEVSAEDHMLGNDDAAVTLLEYGDFECPHCAMAHTILKKIQRQYRPKLRFVYRNFPLTEIHPLAAPAAEAAEFAGAHGKYWEMHDAIFEHQRRLSVEMLAETAEGLGLHGEEAAAAVREEAFADRIERDLEGGERSGVHGTPTFFINGKRHEGAWKFEDLVAAIDRAM